MSDRVTRSKTGSLPQTQSNVAALLAAPAQRALNREQQKQMRAKVNNLSSIFGSLSTGPSVQSQQPASNSGLSQMFTKMNPFRGGNHRKGHTYKKRKTSKRTIHKMKRKMKTMRRK